MNKLSVFTFLFCIFPVFGVYAQSGLSNGSQSGVVQSPSTPSPSVQQPGSFNTAAPGGGQGIIPPQAPTTFSPAGEPAPLSGGANPGAAPSPGAAGTGGGTVAP